MVKPSEVRLGGEGYFPKIKLFRGEFHDYLHISAISEAISASGGDKPPPSTLPINMNMNLCFLDFSKNRDVAIVPT